MERNWRMTGALANSRDSPLASRQLTPCVILAVEHAVPHAVFMPYRIVRFFCSHVVLVSVTHAHIVPIETM